jgi:hypothetical protein
MPSLNLFTKLKESLKRQGKLLLASGLACFIIGLSTSKSHADDNAGERFGQGIWPDAFKKLKDKTREEQVKEDALKLKEKLEEEEEEEEEQERERKQTEAQRNKPSLDNNQVLPSPFQDIELNLKRNSAIDLLLRNSPKPQAIPEQGDETTPARMGNSAKAPNHLRDDDSDEKNENDAHSDKQKDRRKKEEKLLKKPVFVSPNDWVPDKLDPLNNGGFATSPDNGSPVPYRLNGHVDLERGRPWLHD